MGAMSSLSTPPHPNHAYRSLRWNMGHTYWSQGSADKRLYESPLTFPVHVVGNVPINPTIT